MKNTYLPCLVLQVVMKEREEGSLLLKGRNIAFRLGDKEWYSAARADLRRGIRKAKLDYRRKIKDHLSNNSQVWQGLQQMTNLTVPAPYWWKN